MINSMSEKELELYLYFLHKLAENNLESNRQMMLNKMIENDIIGAFKEMLLSTAGTALRQTCNLVDLICGSGFCFSFYGKRPDQSGNNMRRNNIHNSLADQDLPWFCIRFQTRCNIDGITDRSIVHAAAAPDVSDDGIATVDTDTETYGSADGCQFYRRFAGNGIDNL